MNKNTIKSESFQISLYECEGKRWWKRKISSIINPISGTRGTLLSLVQPRIPFET